MNIIITTDYFPPHVGGGVEVATYHIAYELARLGHHVNVVTLNTTRGKCVEDFDGFHVYRSKVIDLTRVSGIQSAFSTDTIRLILTISRREHVDVIHANNLYFITTLAACLSKRMLSKPLVTTLQVGSTSELEGAERYFAEIYERSLGKWVLKEADHIIAVSQAVMLYARSLGVATSRVSVVENSVDLRGYNGTESRMNPNGTVRVAFVGRLIKNKGPQYLVEAAPAILRESPNIEFLIVGEGPMLYELRERLAQLGILDHFRFLGYHAHFLTQCDILVRPSLTEGMPLTVMEAMACGVPTVASDVGGTREILFHGETGYLINPKNVEQLGRYVSRLANDPALRRRMGQRAKAYSESRPSWRDVALRTTEIYESVVS